MSPLLISALTAPAETLINAVLAQDPVAAKRLARYHGKAMSISSASPLHWSFVILVEDERIALRSIYEPATDAAIHGSTSAFARLLLSSKQSDALFSPDIQLSGDTHLIQSLHKIIGGLEIDWEDHFANLFGDVATHQVNQLFGKARTWSRDTKGALLADVEEYLHEEARLLPVASELNQFSARVDEVKLTVDRVSARLNRAFAKLERLRPQ